MKTIGDILRKRRIELGYSIEDIHEKTKLSPVHIRAIENGDMDYFRHDLSYLKFFLQYYCQAVYVDFDEIKDDYNKILESYHETQAIKKQESTQASNENIQRRIQNHQSNYRKPKGSNNIKFKKVENQTLIILVVIALLSALLLFGFFKLVLPRITEDSTPEIAETDSNTQETPVENPSETPNPETNPTPTPEETPAIEQPSGLTIEKEDYANYRISGVDKSSLNLKVQFGSDTWIQAYINDQPATDPASDTYVATSEINIPISAETNKVTILFGNLTNNRIFINDTEVEIDTQARQATNGITLNFHFGGQ